jgi:hypothetical protein
MSNLPPCMMPDGGYCCEPYAELVADWHRWRRALESIAKNTCCDKCQEAALVARAALASPSLVSPANEDVGNVRHD